MKDNGDRSAIRVNPLRLSTDDNYSKLFPEDKSTPEDPFVFNMDNVQFHIAKDSLLITGEMDVTASVFKIDLKQGVKQLKLTNKLTIPCNFMG